MAPPDKDSGGGSATKVVRGHRKSSVTKALGALRRCVAERDVKAVKAQLVKLKRSFLDFESVHDEFHETLTDESEISECEK